MIDLEVERRLREEAFAFVRARQLVTGGPLRFEDVADFTFNGQRVPLLDIRRGIRRPKGLAAALTFRTVHAPDPSHRPYDDDPGPDGYLRYKWRGSDPDHAENRALRAALDLNLQLIWFRGIASGLYLPVFPVELVAEEPPLQQFVVALDAEQVRVWDLGENVDFELKREYAEQTVRRRLHQPEFRGRVLVAYEERCAICRLGFRELLDAAHIRSDRDGGEPIVPNGLSLCRIHHAAYDADLLGIDSSATVHIAQRALTVADGPTLTHAIQEVHGSKLDLPRQRKARPDSDLLAERFGSFLEREAS